MPRPDDERWDRARRAREELSRRLAGRPDVTMVDITADRARDGSVGGPVLRVHLSRRAPRPAAGVDPIPDAIDGLPVTVTEADYDLERG